MGVGEVRRCERNREQWQRWQRFDRMAQIQTKVQLEPIFYTVLCVCVLQCRVLVAKDHWRVCYQGGGAPTMSERYAVCVYQPTNQPIWRVGKEGCQAASGWGLLHPWITLTLPPDQL